MYPEESVRPSAVPFLEVSDTRYSSIRAAIRAQALNCATRQLRRTFALEAVLRVIWHALKVWCYSDTVTPPSMMNRKDSQKKTRTVHTYLRRIEL